MSFFLHSKLLVKFSNEALKVCSYIFRTSSPGKRGSKRYNTFWLYSGVEWVEMFQTYKSETILLSQHWNLSRQRVTYLQLCIHTGWKRNKLTGHFTHPVILPPSIFHRSKSIFLWKTLHGTKLLHLERKLKKGNTSVMISFQSNMGLNNDS